MNNKSRYKPTTYQKHLWILTAAMTRREVKRFVKTNFYMGKDYLAEKQSRLKRLQDNIQPDGKVHVEVWQRDCDMCESTSLHRIPPTIRAYQNLINTTHDHAEGPCSFIILEGSHDWQPTFRDRIAEAWDNGNTTPYIV